ncbi:MAG: cold shock domain-containing protein [Calditrichaeota bacterium]|nr:MAG: cold shock domain-containing protein [Calditrichota bacterium]
METGTVKWFNNAKGYGFIVREDGNDVFVHYKSIVGDGYKTLEQGDQVQYELHEGPKGFHATNVSKLES